MKRNPDYAFSGGINAKLAEKDAEIARLRSELESCKAEVRAWRSVGATLRFGAVQLLEQLEKT